MVRAALTMILTVAISGLLLAGGPEFLDDPGKALDEAYERGAPIMLVYTRDG